MSTKDARCLAEWEASTPQDWVQWFAKHKSVKRFRWTTRGDIGYSYESLMRVEQIAHRLPQVEFMMPTRAWRDPELQNLLRIMNLGHNLKVIASVDVTTPWADYVAIGQMGLGTLFFGDDDATTGRVLCPKTHHLGVTCADCESGCFNETPVHAHLKKHSVIGGKP